MNVCRDLCEICGEGTLREVVGQEEVSVSGIVRQAPCFFSVCESCGSEQAGAEQVRRNKRAVIRLKKEIAGLLSGDEVREVRRRLGLSQRAAAKIFGGGPIAFAKYEADDVIQSEAMDKLLRLASEVPAARGWLLDNGADESGDWEMVREVVQSGRKKKHLVLVYSKNAAEKEPKYEMAS